MKKLLLVLLCLPLLFSSCTNHYKDGKMLFNKGVREKSTEALNNAVLELEMISYKQKNYDEAQKLILRIDSVILTWEENERRRLERQADSLRAVEQEIQERLRLERKNLNLKSEQAIRDFFDKNGTEHIEGIWEFAVSNSENDNPYRLAIIKRDGKYIGTVTERIVTGIGSVFNLGELKATFETAASNDILSIKWRMANKKTEKAVGIVEGQTILKIKNLPGGECMLYKLYPRLEDIGKTKTTKKGEWKGNGSGIIISKSGHIVTNHHVIDDADDIEVEFILDNEVQNFNAEIVQSDKVNDLAIIKIVDVNFDGVNDLPYNFKTRSSDVGTKVYAFGYPMALSIMGKEIKVTDGIISSKTGYDGDITKYQITAPIQGGNSGGPLFDDKGNLIGINAAKLNVNIADNVGYSIKTSYVLNLVDILPKSIDLPSNMKLAKLPLTEQVKEITKYVVLVKVK